MALWADLAGTRGTPIRLAAEVPFTPAPPPVDLVEWAAEVEGLPWGRMTDGLLADVRDDPGSCTPKLAVTAPVSTARLRRLVAA